jgi:hypothetical protein
MKTKIYERSRTPDAMDFYFSIRSGEKRLLEGSGDLSDITIIMGKPRSGKSLFLRYLFALFAEDQELAQFISNEVLEAGGYVVLKIGGNVLECSKPEKEEANAACRINTTSSEKAYLLYEGWLFTAKYGMELSSFQKIANAMRELFNKVSEMKGMYRYDIQYKEAAGWVERSDGRELRFAASSSALGFCSTEPLMRCFPKRCYISLV